MSDKEALKEFNEKFSMNIENVDVKELDFDEKNIGVDGLIALGKINFKNLEKLILNDNEISEIDGLAELKFFNLKELDLSSNGISDISILEKVNFKNLERLILKEN